MTDNVIRPEVTFWIKEGSNFVAIQARKPTAEALAKAAEAFASPTAGEGKIDRTLVTMFSDMAKGEILELPKNDEHTERALKVRVNASAKEAGRTLRWAPDGNGGWLVRVETVTVKPNNSTNGTVATTEETSQETPQEAPAEASSRRR